MTNWAALRDAECDPRRASTSSTHAIVLLAGLADDNAELLRTAATEVADEWASQAVRELLVDAAQLAEIGA